MRKFLLTLTALAIFASCKKSSENTTLTPDIELAPISKVTLLLQKTSSQPTAPQGYVNYNLLGYGYDITGKYDDASSARLPVIDIVPFIKDNFVKQFDSFGGGLDSWNGENAEKLALQLSSGLDITRGRKFHGETITSLFPGNQQFAEKYIYGYYSEVSEKKVLGILDWSLYKYLTPGFKSDLQSMNAEMLVKKYGTHVLLNISIGAKLNLMYQGEVSSANREKVQQAGFDVALKTIFGRSNGAFNSLDSSLLRAIKSPQITFETVGGDPAKIKILETTNGRRVDFTEWEKSISTENSVFIQAHEVLPITNLILDAAKKAEVETYIEAYLIANEVKLTK